MGKGHDRSAAQTVILAERIVRRAFLDRSTWFALVVLIIALPLVVALGVVNISVMLASEQFAAVQLLGKDPNTQALVTRVGHAPVTQSVWGTRVTGGQPPKNNDSDGKTLDSSETTEQIRSQVPAGLTVMRVDICPHAFLSVSGKPDARAKTKVIQTRRPSLLGIASTTSGDLAAGEALISRDHAERLDLTQGDVLWVAILVGPRPDGDTRWILTTVKGFLEEDSQVVVGGGSLDLPVGTHSEQLKTWWILVGPTPVRWQDVRSFNTAGYSVVSRALLAESSEQEQALPATKTEQHTELFPRSHEERVVEGINALGDFPGLIGAIDTEIRGAGEGTIISLAILLLLTELVLLASPAFFTFQRVMNPTLSLLSAVGAPPRILSRVIWIFGLFIGVGSATVSTLGTYLVTRLAATHLGVPPQAGSLWVYPVAVLMPLGVGLIASYGPTRSARNLPVVAVIHRRRHHRSWTVLRSRFFPLLLVLGIGTVLWAWWYPSILGVFVGGISLVTGLAGSLPWLLTGWKHSGGRRLSTRIALREVVRNGHRTLPAMAAILVVTVISISTLVVTRSMEESRWATLPHVGARGQLFLTATDLERDENELASLFGRALADLGEGRAIEEQVEIRGQILDETPSHTRRLLHIGSPVDERARENKRPNTDPANKPCERGERSCPRPLSWKELKAAHIVDDGTWLRLARPVAEEQLETAIDLLNSGGVLVPEGTPIDPDGRVLLRAEDTHHTGPTASTQAIAAHDEAEMGRKEPQERRVPALASTGIGSLVLGPALAEEMGVHSHLLGVLVTQNSGADALRHLEIIGERSADTPGVKFIPLVPDEGATVVSTLATMMAALGVILTVTLVASAAAIETRNDMDVMGAVGAEPAIKRRIRAAQGLLLALHSVPVGAIAGIFIGDALIRALTPFYAGNGIHLTIVHPWPLLALLLTGTPLLCATVAGMFTPCIAHRTRRVW